MNFGRRTMPTLPEKPSSPVKQLERYSMLLYGRKKIGKTTFAAEFPDALFLMTEPGAKALRIYQRYCKTWKQFEAYLGLLDESDRFSTVVVDTIERAYRLCREEVCKEMGIEHPSEADWGRAWDAVAGRFERACTRLCEGRRGVVFISHVTERSIRRLNGTETHRTEITIPKQGREVLEALVDMWFLYDFDDEGRRVLHLSGDDHISAGHRLEGHFVGLERISMGKSAARAYQNFMAAYKKTGPKKGQKAR
jgi:hypothetical protein